MRAVTVIVGLLVLQQSSTKSLPEESVVSVYTSSSSNGTHLDVYHQLANNLAERITSPIYRFLGLNRTTSTTTERPFSKIEIVDDAEVTTKPDISQLNNDISNEKDVEEISADATKKIDKKPEKFTLYSSYLPEKQTKVNDTANEIDADIETFGFDDDVDDGETEATPRQNPFIFVLELIGSFFQLVYGGITSIFSSSSSS